MTTNANRTSERPLVVPAFMPWTRRLVVTMAIQDWLVLAYLFVVFGAVAIGNGPGREMCLRRVTADLAVLVAGLALTRGELLRPRSFLSSFVYRATSLGPVVVSYFQLQHILPAVSSRAHDAQIFALDLHLFGFEPALAWDRFVTTGTTEWFAFFYFSYFALLAVHVIPCVTMGSGGPLAARFALGAYFIFCTAHIIYMIVPGFGPYRYLDGQFAHTLEGPRFWPLVWTTVAANGAQKDIFPSVHTAIPTYCVVFALLNRKIAPFKYALLPLVFWWSQIVIATMFLRWHYLIDIIAGVTLATTAAFGARWVEAWETSRREALHLPPVFGPFVAPPRDP